MTSYATLLQRQRDLVFLDMTFRLASLTSCARRGTGCILVDAQGRVLSAEHNGVGAGQTRCEHIHCPGVSAPSGTGLNLCEAIHAEENALQMCADVYKIHTVYCTTAPCLDRCLRKFFNTSAKRIVYANHYPDSLDTGKALWENSAEGRTWEFIPSLENIWVDPVATNTKLPNGIYRIRETGEPWHGETVHLTDRTVLTSKLYQKISSPVYDRRLTY